MERKVIVFGASGKTGIEICTQLESHKIETFAFVRSSSRDKVSHLKTKVIEGDLLNSKSLSQVFQENQFTDVIIALGSQALRNTSIRSDGTKTILDAMTATNASARIHAISALGTGESWNQLKWHGKLLTNLLLKSVIEDHRKQENYIRNSGFNYHILRPVGLKDGPISKEIYSCTEGYLPSSIINRSELAKYLVDSLLVDKNGITAVCQSK